MALWGCHPWIWANSCAESLRFFQLWAPWDAKSWRCPTAYWQLGNTCWHYLDTGARRNSQNSLVLTKKKVPKKECWDSSCFLSLPSAFNHRFLFVNLKEWKISSRRKICPPQSSSRASHQGFSSWFHRDWTHPPYQLASFSNIERKRALPFS